jgi:acetyltransferase-like isoleucine patch superfamily enzyme
VKRLLKSLVMASRPIMLIALRLFFDRQYLTGRHFEDTLHGYLWCFRAIWQRNILRLARPLPFPAAFNCHVSNGKNIKFHPDDLNNFQSSGTYLQNFLGHIELGRGCYIAPNVGIITANHDPDEPVRHLPPRNVIVGEKCWIGMNSVLLPGVVLGANTVVAAGSVVTKSFPSGRCVVAGVPARVIRTSPQSDTD